MQSKGWLNALHLVLGRPVLRFAFDGKQSTRWTQGPVDGAFGEVIPRRVFDVFSYEQHVSIEIWAKDLP